MPVMPEETLTAPEQNQLNQVAKEAGAADQGAAAHLHEAAAQGPGAFIVPRPPTEVQDAEDSSSVDSIADASATTVRRSTRTSITPKKLTYN